MPYTSRPAIMLLALAAWGCRTDRVEGESHRRDAGGDTRISVYGNDARIRIEGRSALGPEGPRFAWPGTTVHVRFHGTRLDISLRDTPFEDEIEDLDAIGVRIDDLPFVKVPLHEGLDTYRVAAGLRRGRHDVAIVKLTEAEQGTITLASLTTDGRIEQAKAARPRRLLAIGDSITAGYGIDGPEGCHYDARFANASRTWFFRAADALGAERQVIAWSGRGLVYNYDPTLEETMPVLMTRALPTEQASTFDTATFVPDAVVVNLGTNDTSRPDYDRARFGRVYLELLEQLRESYPRARIVVAYGPLISDDYPRQGSGTLRRMRKTLEGVVRRRARAGDRNITMLALPGTNGREGAGCDGHPSAATHERLAGLLVHALSDVW